MAARNFSERIAATFGPALGLPPTDDDCLSYFIKTAEARVTAVAAKLREQHGPNILQALDRELGVETEGKSSAEITLDMLMEAAKPRIKLVSSAE